MVAEEHFLALILSTVICQHAMHHACHVSATTATASSSLLVESVATDTVNMTEHFDTSGIEPNFDGQVSASTEAGISRP
jgi:hypothetical protein